MHLIRRFGAAGAAVALVIAGSVIAYAAWSGTASGNGQAQAISASTVNGYAVIKASTGVADMYPGNTTGGDVYFTVTNGAPFNVTFSGGAVTYGSITVCSNNAGTATNPCTGLTTGNSCPWTVGTSTPVASVMSGAPTTFTMSNTNAPGSATTPINYVGNTASTNVSSQQVLVNVLQLNSAAPTSCEGTIFIVGLSITWTQGP